MKFNWNQAGMPVALVSRLGQRSAYSEVQSVLRDARDQVVTTADTEAMARDLVEGGGREYVDLVRELSTALAETKRELEEANRRYERLTADLAKRGIPIEESLPSRGQPEFSFDPPDAVADGRAEWEEWNRKFQALLG